MGGQAYHPMTPDAYRYANLQVLNDAVATENRLLGAGYAQSFDAYRERVGFIDGLRTAAEQVDEIYVKLFTPTPPEEAEKKDAESQPKFY